MGQIIIIIAFILTMIALFLSIKSLKEAREESLATKIDLDSILEICKQNNTVLSNVYEYQKMLAMIHDASANAIFTYTDWDWNKYENLILSEFLKQVDKDIDLKETLIDMINDNRETNKILSDILKYINETTK